MDILHEQQSMFKSMLESSTEAAAVLDKEFHIIYINEPFEEMFGFTTQEVLDNTCPLFTDTFMSHVEQHLNNLHMGTYETVRQRKDGRLIDINMVFSPILNEQGALIAQTCMVKDITETKQRQAELLENERQLYYLLNKNPDVKKYQELHNELVDSEKQLRTLMDNMPDLICFKDGEGRWIESNDFGKRLFQLEGDSYKGKLNSDLYAFNDFYRDALQDCEETDLQVWEARTSIRYEQVIPQPNETSKVFDIIKVPLFHANGERKSIVIIGRDISKLKESEEQLRKKEKLSAVGELAIGLAHEIRNPLTTISGFLQLFKQGIYKHDYIDTAKKELQQIERLTNELLMFTTPKKFEARDPLALLRQVVALFEPRVSTKNIKLITAFGSNIPFIYCDDCQLKQVFINILDNAIEATPNEKQIIIRAQREGDDVFIQIIDQGEGITEERLKKVGEPFYSNKEKGIGLGLTVSNKIVDTHGGSLQINSQKVSGTTVNLRFPAIV
ncbi:PAS domain S-box protein [Salibacterium salarium]|uniref:histidine kinase n=1 Tax=Salibacterium salarium TaxID=284579 RepID=A0A3R9Q5E7_9BACI|nr:PAS domain S-box protein [Salibacterium salarium]RSL34009.1 PAS domain S-box protein [Salibacterium salarium]